MSHDTEFLVDVAWTVQTLTVGLVNKLFFHEVTINFTTLTYKFQGQKT